MTAVTRPLGQSTKYYAETKALIGRLDVPRIQPGTELAVMFDPEDHTRVALDIYDERK
ncbi:MAG TPA: hypothetical protein VF713_23345 [Thermoanaerobaculia bacterium]